MNMDDRTARAIAKVARLIAEADALLITAGAGMGVDSGLPDFRGNEGFWRAYPALGRLKIPFEQMAQPQWFAERPEMAWAFYGHRQQLYRETTPHLGYHMLLDWGRAMSVGYFVVTSNVDGQFEKAGFPAERILEQHGSIHRLQCARPCTESLWLDEQRDLDIDLETFTARGPLPRCPQCGAVARPNVLMFADPDWLAHVRREQEQRYRQWLGSVRGRRLVILELGAGTAVATIRGLGERLASERDRVTLVRVNPDATESADPVVIPVRLKALEALRRIEEKLPQAFQATARAGLSIERSMTAGAVTPPPTTPVGAAPANTGGLRPLLPQELDTIEFFESSTAESTDPPITEGKIRLRIGALTQVDMGRGLIGWADKNGPDEFDDESACMESYIAAQQAWVPMPPLKGRSAPGYTMTARIFRTPEYDAGGTPGIAIVFVQDPGENAVLTIGMARRASDSPFLWQLLYETASTKLAPLDHPKVPWVALRPDADRATHAAVMPYLELFERTLAWGWLKLAAFIDATQPKRRGR